MDWFTNIRDGITDLGGAITDGFDDVLGAVFESGNERVKSATDQKIDDISGATRANPHTIPAAQTVSNNANRVTPGAFPWAKAGVVVAAVGTLVGIVSLTR